MKITISTIVLTLALPFMALTCAAQINATKTTTMTFPSKTVSIAINKPKSEVYNYVSHPEHFPEWLAFIKSITKQSEGVWMAQSTLGKIKMEFVPPNDFGVVDHVVTMPDGSHVQNTLRIIANGEGSEVSFTLFQLQGKTEADFEKDAGLVRTDLAKLKAVLEGK